MREYLLTEREREIIMKFLEGERPDTFRQLKSIAGRAILRIEEDRDLIRKFLGMRFRISRIDVDKLEDMKSAIQDTVKEVSQISPEIYADETEHHIRISSESVTVELKFIHDRKLVKMAYSIDIFGDRPKIEYVTTRFATFIPTIGGKFEFMEV